MNRLGKIAVWLLPLVPWAAVHAQYSGAGATDQAFVEKAAQGGMMEQELGKLAQERAESEAVREFGARMVREHGAVNDRLREIARTRGFRFPQGLSEKQQRTREELAGLSGPEFDRRYMELMRKDHDKDIELFERHGSQGQNPALRRFAERNVATLLEHRQHAERVWGSLGDATRGQ